MNDDGAPLVCFVVEDAPAGIEAAKTSGTTGLGVADVPTAAGADLVITRLGDAALVERRLYRRAL
jgi:beta-phosphoglucomutase-like phosphatase (HAD superfamily)